MARLVVAVGPAVGLEPAALAKAWVEDVRVVRGAPARLSWGNARRGGSTSERNAEQAPTLTQI
jgi:hypothetical protein